MSKKKKVKVMITDNSDGTSREISADSILCFTLDDVHDSILSNGERPIKASVSFQGRNIPDQVFASIIASLLQDFIKQYYKDNPIKAAAKAGSVGLLLYKTNFTELKGESKNLDDICPDGKPENRSESNNPEKIFLGIMKPGSFEE